MRTLLVAGPFSRVLGEYGLDIVNKEPLTLEQTGFFCRQSQLRYEQILVTDDGLAGLDHYGVKNALANLSLFHELENRKQPIVLVTNRAPLRALDIAGVTVEAHCRVRVPMRKYLDAAAGGARGGKGKARKEATGDKDGGKQPPAKKTILERLRREKTREPEAPCPDSGFEMVSREISRVIAITGHKGAGVTSTVANLARIASSRNLSTIAIDLDTVNCAFNLYFNGYFESAERNQDIACSLIRNLAKPQNFGVNSHQDDNLYVVSLSYSFSDRELLERFFSPAKLINMLTVFRKHFQVCLLDMPIEALARLKESILYVDTFGLCVSNNLYSLSSTLRAFMYALAQEEMDDLFGKSVVIVSKYNENISIQDEFFSPDKVCDLLLELSEAPIAGEFELAGHIPYHPEFDTQLETDIPIVSSDAYMEKAYSDILLRMIKGAGKQ